MNEGIINMFWLLGVFIVLLGAFVQSIITPGISIITSIIILVPICWIIYQFLIDHKKR